jgi:hypothetical protein
MTDLRIAKDLALPLDWMQLATVVYGARGSGKTSLGRVFAEEAHRAGQRFCAIDLKGDWWGLKSTADGKGDGIPVVVFGGDHADVPLEDGAGEFVASTVAELGQSSILDFEHFSKGKQTRFLAQFFARLYDANRDPLLLLLDEAQRYAPQRTFDPDSAKCLGAVEDLVKLGRKHGLGPVLFTQRGSGLNKEVSELCDMLVACRTPGPLDQERVKDWLDANLTKAQREVVMGKLSGLPTGTAVFASGHPDLKVSGVHAVRRPETFDSSATPKIGERRIEPKRLAKPDLEALRVKMSEAIERAKADDPKALRARIAELEAQLADGESGAGDLLVEENERLRARVAELEAVPAFDRLAFNELRKSIDEELDGSKSRVADLLRGFRSESQWVKTPPTPPFDPDDHRAAKPIKSNAGDMTISTVPTARPAGDGSLPKVERLILLALAQHAGKPMTRERLALLVGYHANSKSFANGLGALRGRGAVEGLAITKQGRAELGRFEPLPTGRALLEWYCANKLTPAEARIARAIAAARVSLSREELAAKVEYHPNAKSFANGLGRLRGLGIVDGLQLSAELRG